MFKQQLHEKKNNLTLRMMTFLVENTQTLKMIPVLDGIAQIIKNADEENQSVIYDLLASQNQAPAFIIER